MILPPNLALLFRPRDPVEYLPPGKLPQEKRFPPYTGIASFVARFEDPKETPLPHKIPTLKEIKETKQKAKCDKADEKLKDAIALYNPKESVGITNDPFKTLFVARISYAVNEAKLIREFEQFGRIRQGRMITSNLQKPRGYAFLEFEKEEDMLAAYKHGDGMKIEGKRVLVDVERGRTVEGFLPRRLGGGIGATRKGKPEECVKHSGREPVRHRSPERHGGTRHQGERRGTIYRDRDDPGYRSDSGRSRGTKDGRRDKDRDRERERDKEREKEKERDRERDKNRNRSDRHR